MSVVTGDAVRRNLANTVVDIESGAIECQRVRSRFLPGIRRYHRGAALAADDGVEVYGVSDAVAPVVGVIKLVLPAVTRRKVAGQILGVGAIS